MCRQPQTSLDPATKVRRLTASLRLPLGCCICFILQRVVRRCAGAVSCSMVLKSLQRTFRLLLTSRGLQLVIVTTFYRFDCVCVHVYVHVVITHDAAWWACSGLVLTFWQVCVRMCCGLDAVSGLR
jgi:hypothetical protein